MFVPIKDDTPLQFIRFQYVTLALAILNVALFLITGPLMGIEASGAVLEGYGMVPRELFGFEGGFSPVAEPLTLITYQFLHGGWLHLLSNMAFLWVFADNVEDAYGPILFTVFYLLCGAAGGVAHAMLQPQSPVPLIGASGAVSGVIGAYLLLYPHARIWVLLFMRIPIRLPAIWILGGWIAFQFFSLLSPANPDMPVAWWAHIGGLAMGVFLTLAMRLMYRSQA